VPSVPDEARREALLAALGDLIERGGSARVLAPPVAPGPEAFPDRWASTAEGVAQVLRRLAWHAQIDEAGDRRLRGEGEVAGHGAGDSGVRAVRRIVVRDQRIGAPPTARKPETIATAERVTRTEAVVTLQLVGEDDVVGTLAHEIGVIYAALTRIETAEPYRTAAPDVIEIEPERDLERGSIATVYLGLGVIAANAAYQQYSASGRFNGAYVPLEYDVVRAGAVPMSELAFLLAVQAVIRGQSGPPAGLGAPQRDETAAWIAVLKSQRDDLCARFGTNGVGASERPKAEPFADAPAIEATREHGRRVAFRWRSNRGGIGFLAGLALGGATAVALAMPGVAAPLVVVAGAGIGHVAGRRIPVARCSACVRTLPMASSSCVHCGAAMRGDIARLADRLEAEEQLDHDHGA